MAPGGGRKMADPRNISDKGFKDRSVRKLIEYLIEHGFERTLSPQLLTAPSVKDFVHIISFLLKAAIPNFDFDKKFEEEVPEVLKALGYPYNIPKSSLQSVGAPHAWPPILAALAWLVDLLRYSEAVSAEAEGSDSAFDNDDGNKMFFDYLSRGYALFLQLLVQILMVVTMVMLRFLEARQNPQRSPEQEAPSLPEAAAPNRRRAAAALPRTTAP